MAQVALGPGKRGNRKSEVLGLDLSDNPTYQEFVDLIGSEIACAALAQLITVLGEFGLSFVGDGSVRVVL